MLNYIYVAPTKYCSVYMYFSEFDLLLSYIGYSVSVISWQRKPEWILVERVVGTGRAIFCTGKFPSAVDL